MSETISQHVLEFTFDGRTKWSESFTSREKLQDFLDSKLNPKDKSLPIKTYRVKKVTTEYETAKYIFNDRELKFESHKCISCGSEIEEENLKVCNKCASKYQF